MEKQNEYRFNLKFDETEEDHRRVSEFLNNCGRKKARYVVKAILAYWELQDGKISAIDKSRKREAERSEEVLTEPIADRQEGTKDRLIKVSSGGNEEMDQEEAELMMQNYALFDDME